MRLRIYLSSKLWNVIIVLRISAKLLASKIKIKFNKQIKQRNGKIIAVYRKLCYVCKYITKRSSGAEKTGVRNFKYIDIHKKDVYILSEFPIEAFTCVFKRNKFYAMLYHEIINSFLSLLIILK